VAFLVISVPRSSLNKGLDLEQEQSQVMHTLSLLFPTAYPTQRCRFVVTWMACKFNVVKKLLYSIKRIQLKMVVSEGSVDTVNCCTLIFVKISGMKCLIGSLP